MHDNQYIHNDNIILSDRKQNKIKPIVEINTRLAIVHRAAGNEKWDWRILGSSLGQKGNMLFAIKKYIYFSTCKSKINRQMRKCRTFFLLTR